MCIRDSPKKGDTKFEASFADVRAVLVVPPVESSKPGEAATLVLAAMPRPPPLAEPPSTKQMVDAYKKASLTASLADKVARVPLDAAALGRAFPQLRILGGATLGDALPEALARATACGAVEPVLKGAPGAGTTFFAAFTSTLASKSGRASRRMIWLPPPKKQHASTALVPSRSTTARARSTRSAHGATPIWPRFRVRPAPQSSSSAQLSHFPRTPVNPGLSWQTTRQVGSLGSHASLLAIPRKSVRPGRIWAVAEARRAAMRI